MKPLITLLFLCALLAGCTSVRPSAAERAQRLSDIAAAVGSRSFTVEMSTALPLRFPSRNLEYGYNIRVKGDTLYSALPYFGRAWSVPYSGGSALRFKERISSYEARQQKDGVSVELKVGHDNDTYRYLLYIYDNGKASLDVNCTNRDNISFTGQVKYDSLKLRRSAAPLTPLSEQSEEASGPMAYDMRYVKQHTLLHKDGEVNVVDVDLEWPNAIDGQNVVKLRRYIARHLLQVDDSAANDPYSSFSDVYARFLHRYGEPVNRQFDTIPDDRKFCYITASLRNLYYAPGRFISFGLQSFVKPLPLSSQKPRSWNTMITYDITRDTVFTVKSLLKEGANCHWRKNAWQFDLDIDRDDYISMDVPWGCMAAVDKILLITRQWERRDDGTASYSNYSVLTDADKVRRHLSKDAKYLMGDKLWPIHPQPIPESVSGYAPSTPADVVHFDSLAAFPGGPDSLRAYVQRSLVYPKEARQRMVEGRNTVQFFVDKDGRVSEPRVVRSLSPECDREAVRVVMAMPRWRPAVSAGRRVGVVNTLPFLFKLK